MNSTTRGNSLYTYHTITNAEFTGVIDKYKVYGYVGNYGAPETFTECVSSMYDYHIFIKYGDKIYMDVKNVGEIVITFAELQQNKFWKHYYNLSLMLSNDKHLVVQDLEYNSDFYDPNIYEGKRYWSCNTAYIDGECDTKTKKIVENEYNCYYRINPYDLENMKYSSQKDLTVFKNIYNQRYEVRAKLFEKRSIYYSNIAIDYCASLMETELDELSVIFEDKKNAVNLATLNDKEGMNGDILMIIYNNLINTDENKKYEHLMTELGTRNRLESIARIMAA
jgi:hypothetical protein